MGSFRFRRSVKIAPGIRLNVNKKSVGISGGVRGVRASVNSDGRSTRSVGVPGTGLYYRSQSSPRTTRSARPVIERPSRLLRHLVGWVAGGGFVLLILSHAPRAAGVVLGIGLLLVLVLWLGGAVVDALFYAYWQRRSARNNSPTDDI